MPKSVLVIDAIATHRIRFAALLESAHYLVATAASAADYPGSLGEVDLVLLGLSDDSIGASVASLNAALQTRGTPILCLDDRSSPLRRLLVLRAGARDVLPSKSPDDLVLTRIRGLLREFEAARECERRRLTAVSFGLSEASPTFQPRARVVCTGAHGAHPGRLAALLPHEIQTLDTDQILDNDAAAPDAFVVWLGEDSSMIDGLLPELRDRTPLRQAPVMVVYPPERPDLAAHALKLGATDATVSSAGIEEIELRVSKMLARKHLRDMLRVADEQSYRMAATDPLTGLYNRRYAETYLTDILARGGWEDTRISLMIVDLDHFKQVNDTYGHSTGDHVLVEVAHRLQDNLRACDLVARYGGEEFLIVLPDTTEEAAMGMAERLRDSVSNSPVHGCGETALFVSASIGVASSAINVAARVRRTGTFGGVEPLPNGLVAPIFEAADAALYRAKARGRNCVELNVV